MSQEADASAEKEPELGKPSHRSQNIWDQAFVTPQPIKQLFNKFPLVTYPSNELPKRTAKCREQHKLYIFTTRDGANTGAPSFNPGCLKWQAFLHFKGIEFITIRSNNHASPSGALPFLLPSSSSVKQQSDAPISSNRIQRWTREQLGLEREHGRAGQLSNPNQQEEIPKTNVDSDKSAPNMRYEAYMSLLDYRIRNAYLYTLYLSTAHFDSIVRPLYIDPTTSNSLVRLAQSQKLRAAAESELLKSTAIIDAETIYCECAKAFQALQGLLGEDDYFFGATKPGLFDASVFAYTNLLLSESMPQLRDTRMMDGLDASTNLKSHRNRLIEKYFLSCSDK